MSGDGSHAGFAVGHVRGSQHCRSTRSQVQRRHGRARSPLLALPGRGCGSQHAPTSTTHARAHV
eukprot:4394901-Alexandrium_andersonii.AAC.1